MTKSRAGCIIWQSCGSIKFICMRLGKYFCLPPHKLNGVELTQASLNLNRILTQAEELVNMEVLQIKIKNNNKGISM